MGSENANKILNDLFYHPKHSEEGKIYNHYSLTSLLLIWQEKQD